jgi:SAM-dependent methyltransferase
VSEGPKFEPSAADFWDERYRGIDHLWIPGPDQPLVAALDKLPGGTAVDLACGEGRNALYLAKAGWNVTAVDFSQVALDRLSRAAEVSNVTIDVVNDDLESFLQIPSVFDLVVIANFHPERSKRIALYRSAFNHVAPGGHFFLIGHHLDGLGIAGPTEPDMLLDESEIHEVLQTLPARIEYLDTVTEVADHGHRAPSLVALLVRL